MVKLTDIIGTDLKLVEKPQGNTGSYAKYLLPHMMSHYELFVRTTRSSQEAYSLTLEQLLAYHVYGDYVLVADGNKTKLTYHDNSGNGITGVTGIYEPPSDSDRTNIRYRNDKIKWLEEEIQRGSSGVRLMLPSMGTQIISTFGFGNIAKELRKYLKESLRRLNDFIADREDSSAPVTGFDYTGTEINPKLTKSNVKDYILQRLANELPFVETTLDPLLPSTTSFDDLLDEFLKEFITTNVAKFEVNNLVYVKSVPKLTGSKKDALVNAVKEAMSYGPDDEVDLEFEEFKVTSVTPPLEGETRAEMRVSYMDEEVEYVFDHEDFKKTENQDVDTGATTKKGKKYYREPGAQDLERYRIFLDKMYEIQAALFVEHFGERGDKTVPWYVSDRLIPSKNLKIMEKYFPDITRRFDEPQGGKKSIKKENSLIHTLCQHRLAITTTSLIAQRTLAFDKKMFDDFYNGDMLLKEINWLTAALTDWGRVVIESPREGNPLAVVKGVPVGSPMRDGVPVVQSVAEATRQLAIYRLEVPMLKQVIKEYNELYNAFTISNVFNMADGDPKEAQLAKALWGGITNRTVGIFDIPGVKPHDLFDKLFKNVSDALSQKSSFGIDPYPPSWADSQILGQLVRDPRYVIGDRPSLDDYKKYLKEYLQYLQSKYSSRWIVASAIISVVDNYRVTIATDANGLRQGFLKRIQGDAKKSTLKGRYIQFDAYGQLIAILRAQISIPLDLRDDFISKEIDKELGLVIKDRTFDEKRPVFGKGHPNYRPPMREEAPPTPGLTVGTITPITPPTPGLTVGPIAPIRPPPITPPLPPPPPPPITPPISDSEEIPEWPEMPPSLPPDDDDPVIPPEEWNEATPVIPEENEIEEVEEVYNNPKLHYDNRWMYFERETQTSAQINISMKDGETVQYKLHISLKPDDYMTRTRAIVATFLSMNKIHYKSGGSSGHQDWRQEGEPQYGKMFTLYPKDEDQFFKIVKGMQILAEKYNLEGIDFSVGKANKSNMTYERPVPNTRKTLYYTVEGCTREGLRKAVRDQIDKDGYWSYRGRGMKKKFDNWVDEQLNDYSFMAPIVYLGGLSTFYQAREKVMDYYNGQGPLDFLY
jgi:hypothetical protein